MGDDMWAASHPDDQFADYTDERLLAFLDRHQLIREPGARFKYSNLGMGLVGYLLTRAASSDYETVLRTRITSALGMNDTMIALPSSHAAGRAAPLSVRAPGENSGTEQAFGWLVRRLPADELLMPVASQQFRRTERVHIEWPIAGPLDSREGRLLGRNGEPVAVTITLTEIARDGRPVLALDGLLAPLAPGDYVVEVTAGVAGKTETRLVAIRVVS